MTNDHRGLVLRRLSIRTLTAPELGLFQGGRPNGTSSPTSGPTDRTIPPTRTK